MFTGAVGSVEAPIIFGLTMAATKGPPTAEIGVPNGSALKSPDRIASDGTNPVTVWPCRWDFCSPSRKKNVLFFRIGPPSEPPYWFRLNFSGEVAKKLFASSEVLRKNSNNEP